MTTISSRTDLPTGSAARPRAPAAHVDTRALFEQAADSYDRSRPLLIPCFDDFYGTVLELIDCQRDTPLRVLDLGAGTGLLAALICAAFPAARVTLLDFAPAMLARARARLSAESARVAFQLADFASEPLPGVFDVVVSALSIHHLGDDAKCALYHKVHGALAGGGIFINADQVLAPTPQLERIYDAVWLRQAHARGASAEDIAGAVERMQADRPATLAAQLEWLAAAGFEHVNCWYQHYRFAVFSGRKYAHA